MAVDAEVAALPVSVRAGRAASRPLRTRALRSGRRSRRSRRSRTSARRAWSTRRRSSLALGGLHAADSASRSTLVPSHSTSAQPAAESRRPAPAGRCPPSREPTRCGRRSRRRAGRRRSRCSARTTCATAEISLLHLRGPAVGEDRRVRRAAQPGGHRRHLHPRPHRRGRNRLRRAPGRLTVRRARARADRSPTRCPLSGGKVAISGRLRARHRPSTKALVLAEADPFTVSEPTRSAFGMPMRLVPVSPTVAEQTRFDNQQGGSSKWQHET